MLGHENDDAMIGVEATTHVKPAHVQKAHGEEGTSVNPCPALAQVSTRQSLKASMREKKPEHFQTP